MSVVLTLKLVDGLALRLADGHHARARGGTDSAMTIATVRGACHRAMAIVHDATAPPA
jgi:hypothetical protein